MIFMKQLASLVGLHDELLTKPLSSSLAFMIFMTADDYWPNTNDLWSNRMLAVNHSNDGVNNPEHSHFRIFMVEQIWL